MALFSAHIGIKEILAFVRVLDIKISVISRPIEMQIRALE